MSDAAYLRKLAERYRKLARSFKHAAIRERLETLADDLEQKVRELQQQGLVGPDIATNVYFFFEVQNEK